MSFHVGQKVVCVNDRRCVLIRYRGWRARFRGWIRLDHNLNRGDVYRVEKVAIYPTTDKGAITVLFVDGARHFKHPDVGFPSFQFRPVVKRKTDISVFNKMLKPKLREMERA